MQIEDLMADFGRISRQLADDPSLRWLGPHKGVVHLALASITNACFDLWAKSRGVPLWSLLLELNPEEITRLLDLSYVEDVISSADAIALLNSQMDKRPVRESTLRNGYPGYDTSVGWLAYDDRKVRELTARAKSSGLYCVQAEGWLG
jgi:L-fuconate dehydratase